MFLHNFKYTLKTLFRNRSLLFWTFAFPLIMATFFHMAFADITEDEQLKTIDIAIVNNNEFNNNMLYKQTFNTLSDDNNEDKLFNITYTDREDAKKLLEDKKIEGYLELNNNTPKLTFQSNGINQTIIKYVVDEIHDTEKMISSMKTDMKSGMNSINTNVCNYVEAKEIELKDTANDNLNYIIIEYFTLIAMTCLYAGSVSMVSINKTLPYLTGKGKRVTVAPTKRSIIIFSSLLASFLVQLLTLGLLFVYLLGVLNVEFGCNVGLMVLLSLVGSLAGVALGLLVGTFVKATENSKTGIMIAITMAGSFLSGMMGVGMKYQIDKNLPLLNKINPANMITDGFYALYYYTDYSRFWFNIGSLLIFISIAVILSSRKIGRARYDSI
ncbi:MAG: ABC transporter permease [Bacilli bacterium]|nr:ABC transporter permease [Bacilli bacterium]